jgi:CxxC motif-containing protein (DUF1111 family)
MRGQPLLSGACIASFALVTLAVPMVVAQTPPTEAPAGFDDESNGMTIQTVFDSDREVFEEREDIADGLGPVYNAQSCAECHQNPVAGGASQITELRAGYGGFRRGFREPPGGSLINDRAIHPDIQERVPDDARIQTLRASVGTLGDGFVEAIADETLIEIAEDQRRQTRGRVAGEVVQVPILESPGTSRPGRFGWKNQHGSLLSFAADAYLNEMGITSPFMPEENSSMGQSVAPFDDVVDPEDSGDDLEIFARFMRATKAPPRDEALAAMGAAQVGSQIFEAIGCATCHVSTIVTAPVGTVVNGGAFTVPEALGDKIIHPYGDFLLHDIGTGDGIVQNGPDSTASKMRTAPLWGLRTRTRYMHDGESLTMEDAILRHRGEASGASRAYRFLGRRRREQVLTFLSSL